MIYHYTHPYLITPQHRVTIDLVGMGGTGSQVLTGLARMNEALLGLGHPGLHVRAWDNDEVTTANLGRQMFSQADLGLNKAVVLISRVNKFFGSSWESMPENYTGSTTSNIIITCIDTAKGRVEIDNKLNQRYKFSDESFDRPIYWLDLGNLQHTGQVVLGTLCKINQPKVDFVTRAVLPTVVKKFPALKRIREETQGPSCSLAEALEKQDLFINSTLAQFGCNILWKLFKEQRIKHHGCFINLENLVVNPIKI